MFAMVFDLSNFYTALNQVPHSVNVGSGRSATFGSCSLGLAHIEPSQDPPNVEARWRPIHVFPMFFVALGILKLAVAMHGLASAVDDFHGEITVITFTGI